MLRRLTLSLSDARSSLQELQNGGPSLPGLYQSGKKKNEIPRGPVYFDAPPAAEASATEEGERNAMRVSVSWASARDGADDVLGATAYDGVAIDADVAAASVGFEEDEKDEKDETSRVTEPQTKRTGSTSTTCPCRRAAGHPSTRLLGVGWRRLRIRARRRPRRPLWHRAKTRRKPR